MSALMDARYSSSSRRLWAWDITPWQVLQMVIRGSPDRSARAKLRAFSVSPSRSFFSCRTPDPVQEALAML